MYKKKGILAELKASIKSVFMKCDYQKEFHAFQTIQACKICYTEQAAHPSQEITASEAEEQPSRAERPKTKETDSDEETKKIK